MKTTPRKKLIEVALPLEEINKASAREKSIRHGHPSTLHLWWARRPLAACRAVIFAQLVDDPSAWPKRFPSPEAQAEERQRLHDLIARMVPWEASNNEAILNEVRFEIARSVAWGKGEEPPNKPAEVLAYLQRYAPPVYDPFCGGGSIPLEAQRLGLRAYGSDLNPVAVLISKALVEIPPKFAGQKPINPEAREKKELIGRQWTGAQGLAEDVRYYGRWMRAEAERRIGHLYPKAILKDGVEATTIAWLWARTVRSPDPAAKGAHVPLVSTFLLSSKEGKKSWVEIVRDANAQDGWRFNMRLGTISKDDEVRLKLGTKSGKGQAFVCALTGSPVSREYIQAEGKAQRLGARLMAIVAEGARGRIYVAPDAEHEKVAAEAGSPPAIQDARSTFLSGLTPTRAMITGGVCSAYGLFTWGHLFTSRQIAALTTFSDLVGEVRAKVLVDAHASGLTDDSAPLHSGGIGTAAYADAIATYLAFVNSRNADRFSALCSWDSSPKMEALRNTFARQALPMVWDYAEGNPFSSSSGNVMNNVEWVATAVEATPAVADGAIHNINAPKNSYPVRPVAISTDPPYYDNIGYADLSDFFYVWLRHSLGEREGHDGVWPDLFRRLLAPKAEELTATPYRFAENSPPAWTDEVPGLFAKWTKLTGRDRAEAFFMHGMSKALKAMHDAAEPDTPLAVYYAYKQSEITKDGTRSPGWVSFLQAVADAGLAVDATWPVRTELSNRMIGMGTNALASSIVHVCRKRDPLARSIDLDEFKRILRRELPDALTKIRAAGISVVDMPQASIGPGIGVFTRFASVLEPSGDVVNVGKALQIVEEIIDELESADEGVYDPETRFAIDWFAHAQWGKKPSGDADTMARPRNLGIEQLERAGIIEAHAGKTRLRTRAEIGGSYDPDRDATPTVWEHTMAIAHALEQGGQDRAAALFARLSNTESVRALGYRLGSICLKKHWPAEAQVWNRLAEEWRRIEDLAMSAPPPVQAPETDLFGGAA
jgi:putative DNA methylase